MLQLASETDAAWADAVLPHLDEVLLEQAHLERKAASAALTFMFRYSEQTAIQEPLSRLAREELLHFELVLAALRRRGVPFGRQVPSPYAAQLHASVRMREPERFLDGLLCCALIEARSCERMRLLHRALRERARAAPEDAELAALVELYHVLVASEARHHGCYLGLAREVFGESAVVARWAGLAAHEAAVVAAGGPAPRLHV